MTRPGLIRCVPYSCDLSAEACAKRYVSAQSERRHLHLAHCRRCEAGCARAEKLKTTMPPRTKHELRLRWGNGAKP